MYNLVNSNFNRTYNPIGSRNALSDIKRLLTSRDTIGQTRACGYVAEVIKRHQHNSEERTRMIEYLLDNDIVVFLCEATTNLSLPLFRIVLECIRLLWSNRRFFDEEHAATTMAAVLRSLSHYSATDTSMAVDACLHLLCDLLNGIRVFESTPALSHQSPYNVEQLLACMHGLGSRICANHNVILSSALVLHSLITYQPSSLDLRNPVVAKVFEVINQWLEMLVGSLKHKVLVEDDEFGMFLVILSQIGIDVLRLIKVLETVKPTNFVQSLLADEQEVDTRTQSVAHMRGCVGNHITEIVVLVKDNQEKINNDEYSVFLKFLLAFLCDNSEALPDFCDALLTNGYLAILPQYQILRNDKTVRKISTLILGELLKVLTEKYLISPTDNKTYATDIQMGLVELQNGVEKPDNIGLQLQKRQPYSLLIYIYFYCQSTEMPEECTENLLPHLVDHVLSLPKNLKPPAYIIKALWLVFAMSTISTNTLHSLNERVRLEQATDRIVGLVYDVPLLYTHHPCLLLWSYSSQRIPATLRVHVLSQWLARENCLPEDLCKEPSTWNLLLSVLIHNTDKTTLSNCIEALHYCLSQEENCADFASHTWALLPNVLSRALIDPDNVINPNISYLLDIATTHLPASLEQADCYKIAVLITTLYSKTNTSSMDAESRARYEYASLKLCMMLLEISQEHNDDKVLLTVVNRIGFLPTVLAATESVSDDVACIALQLLSYTVVYFTKNKYSYQAKSILQLQTENIIKSLRKDSSSERGTALLHLVHTVLGSGYTPLVLTYYIQVDPPMEHQVNALQALLFRVQLILCCQNTDNQSPTGWKALNSIFKHALMYRNDPKLVAILSTQPWTFTLLRFQLTQPPTKEFLTFTLNWLTLLKITLSKCKSARSVYISKYSLTRRTLVMIRKVLKAENDEDCTKVVMICNEMLNCNTVDE
ncbi:uncharacterized protein LOC121737393 [Aricia agestis]|uniref:uncharacterized protein LOC121737393 n=1 Tax=Aricia agestis TaxID=91739 RepID=UPI001C207238|nr:uncharacterized protein LOC121737393 [Aricia agestis]